MRLICVALAATLLAFQVAENKPTAPAQILVIRHAEKPPEGDPSVDLTDTGKKRADALVGLFQKSDSRPTPLPTPDFLFAAKNSKQSHRPMETITPLAKKLGLTINEEFRNEDFAKLADEVLKNPKYAGKTVLICWHHGEMPALAKALRATDGVPDKVKATLFDRVWVISYANGKTTFANLPQQLLAGDAVK